MKKHVLLVYGLTATLAVSLLSAAAPGKKTIAIPEHPSKLRYAPLNWEVPTGEQYRAELPNGLIAYVAKDSSLPLVQITGYIRYGSIADPTGKEGISSLLATLMRSGGTRKYPADSLNELIDLLAMKIGFSSKESQFTFNASFLAEYTDIAFDVLEQMLFYPSFESKKLDLEKKIMLRSIQHRFDNPGPTLNAAYQKMMYKGQEPGRLPTEKSVQEITSDDLAKLHKKLISSGQMIISVAGSFHRDSMLQQLEKVFPKSTSSTPIAFPQIDIKPAMKCLIIDKPISQAYIRLGLPLFKRPHPDYYAMSVLNMILGGGGFTSRLGTKIRSDAGLTYSIYSHAESNYSFPGTFYIDFYTKNASFAQAVAMTIEEVRRAVSEGITKEELAHAKASLIGEMPSMFRSPFDIVSTYAWNEYYGRSPDHFKVYEEKLNAITRDDILRVAKQYLTAENFTYTIVGDKATLIQQDVDGFSLSKMENRSIPADSIPLLP